MTSPTRTPRRDAARDITDRIITALERGAPPWKQPWTNGFATLQPLRANGAPYTGVNVLILWDRAGEMGFENPRWMTFRQARELGGAVRKGERAALIIYVGSATKAARDDNDGEEERSFRFLKTYPVFNAAQIDGLPAHFHEYRGADVAKAPPSSERAAFFERIGASIRHGGDRAFFRDGEDVIQMPPYGSFSDPERYFATLAHEAIHWTGGKARLGRLSHPMDLEARAFEELVAEIGAAMLGAHLRLAPDHVEDHAAYVASWLKALKGDKRFVLKAAAAAQKACDFLLARAGPGFGAPAAALRTDANGSPVCRDEAA